ncbi:MAG: hypothetical protein AAB426_09095 [Myxococcota bacterium]
MKRLLASVALSLSYGCIPATQEGAPPTPSQQAEPGHADADRRFAAPPDGPRDEAGQWEPPPGPSGAPPRESEPRRRTAAPTAAEPSAGAASEATGSVGGMAYDKAAPAERPRAKADVDDRPGLGTSWGETRYSAVSDVPFERDGGRPSYSAALHYNDQRGAYALAGGDSAARATTAAIDLGAALTVWLRDEYGSGLAAYRGNGRTVAVGQQGQRYTIVVQNNTNERFEVVLSVDGLDVIDGGDAGYGKRGYLVEAYGSVEVDGFRQSEDAVAAFRFGTVRDSYAARTGSARNVGVIGAAAFGERGYTARLRAYQDRIYSLRINGVEVERRSHADPFPNRYATPPLQSAR